MDPVFDEEQTHLTEAYAKLQQLEQEVTERLEAEHVNALEDKKNLFDELTRDLSADIQLESLAELEAMNRIIDSYNLSADVNTEKLRRLAILLEKPYFAKISISFPDSKSDKDIYIGAAGMTDDKRRHFIIDWRSPIAELYYNQANGRTHYEANGRVIDVDLNLRRQFEIKRDVLEAYFDTTVAIEDPLLLRSLARHHSDHLSAITATIQKEQNEVIRHKDVPTLLVQGIAGSGKTSVLLQRIAYLFYRERDDLNPSDVFLITPNPVFTSYIDQVLPDMGESNPHILTWDSLMERIGLAGRGIAKDTSMANIESIDASLGKLELDPNDICDIRVDGERVIGASSIRSSIERFAYLPMGPHRFNLVMEDLNEKLEQRIARLSREEDEQDALADLPEQEQLQIFGQVITPFGEEEARELTERWLRWRYRTVPNAIENGDWLRIDRIGMSLLGQETLDSTEWLYLKLALIGGGERHARYVMIDEVQDYNLPQLAVLARFFPNARFLLLGDKNQAVTEGTATFNQIRELFSKIHGELDECSLMISYRSSPEITKLFCKLLPEDERVRAESVQRPGIEPQIVECKTEEEYSRALADIVRKDAQGEGTHALIANSKDRAKQIWKMLKDECGDVLHRVAGDGSLPKDGVALLDVKLAKGLEFDTVIVPDVQEGAFPNEPLRRHRLYTAISRATEQVTLVALGELSKLLR